MDSGQLPVKRGDNGAVDTGRGNTAPAGLGDSSRGEATLGARGDNTNSMFSDVPGRAGPNSAAASVDFPRDLSEATSLMSSCQQHTCGTGANKGRQSGLERCALKATRGVRGV
jgi:hypothetical protein